MGGSSTCLVCCKLLFFCGWSSTCLVCCRLLFFCGWLEHVPCLLYWSTYARHVCGSRAFVSNHLIFFVGLISPNFLFPVGISRIFSTTPLIFFSPLVFREFSPIFPVGISRIFSTTVQIFFIFPVGISSSICVPICKHKST